MRDVIRKDGRDDAVDGGRDAIGLELFFSGIIAREGQPVAHEHRGAGEENRAAGGNDCSEDGGEGEPADEGANLGSDGRNVSVARQT